MTTETLNKTKAANEAESSPAFAVQSIYTKDVSYEAPSAPKIFEVKWEPKVDFDLQMENQELTPTLTEVTLDVTTTVKLGSSATVAFIVEVKQAGIFSIQDMPEREKEHLLATLAPGILFPYASQVISNCVTNGGFPQLVLPPINFEAMYFEHLSQQANNKKS